MTAEKDELEADLRAVYGELFPHRNPATMRISDDVLTLGVLLRRELRNKIDRLPSAYAEGGEPQPSAKSKHIMEES